MGRTARGIRGAALMAVVVGMSMARDTVAGCEMVSLERAAFGPYGGRAFVVANSEAGWRSAMTTLEGAGVLAFVPGPDPPTGVDWDHEVVILVAAGATGYDVELLATPAGPGLCEVGPRWIPLVDQDGGESRPYHVVKMTKHDWLGDLVVLDAEVDASLPLVGSAGPEPVGAVSWGLMKVSYR